MMIDNINNGIYNLQLAQFLSNISPLIGHETGIQ